MNAVHELQTAWPPDIVDLPMPTPGPGEVWLHVAGAAVCHSGLHGHVHGIGLPGPFTLRHENAGWIAGPGAGVEG